MDSHLKEIRIASSLAYGWLFLEGTARCYRAPRGKPASREHIKQPGTGDDIVSSAWPGGQRAQTR